VLRLLVVGTLAFALSLPAIVEAKRRSSPACTTKTAKTLVATKGARVFKQRGRIYACLYRPGRSFQIGGRNSSRGTTDVANLRLAGRYVAYSKNGPGGITLVSRELRRGIVARDVPAAVATTPGLTAITDLSLRTNGSLAWIAKRTRIDGPLSPYAISVVPDYQVRKSDRSGEALLDAGSGVVPGSLSLLRGTVSWMKGDDTYSAALD